MCSQDRPLEPPFLSQVKEPQVGQSSSPRACSLAFSGGREENVGAESQAWLTGMGVGWERDLLCVKC